MAEVPQREVLLTGRRRLVLEPDGARWKVAFYRPMLDGRPVEPGRIERLEKQAHRRNYDARKALGRLKIARSTAAASTLPQALREAVFGQARDVGEDVDEERELAEAAFVEEILAYLEALPGRGCPGMRAEGVC